MNISASRAVASVLRSEYLRAYAAQHESSRNSDRHSRRWAQWLVRAVLSHVDPPQAVNALPAMPKRRPVLHLRRVP